MLRRPHYTIRQIADSSFFFQNIAAVSGCGNINQVVRTNCFTRSRGNRVRIKKRMKNFKKQLVNHVHGAALLIAVLGGLSLAGCATAQKNQTADAKGTAASAGNDGQGNYDDPLEGYNRVMFKVNDVVDQAIMQPVAMGYRTV